MERIESFDQYLRVHAPGATLHEDGFQAEEARHGGDLIVTPHAQRKPWGGEVWKVFAARYAVKTLFVSPGMRLSLQHHVNKEETWFFVTDGWAIIDDVEHHFPAGAIVHLTPGRVHRLVAKETPVIVDEVSTPELMDVVRHEDDFQRPSTS